MRPGGYRAFALSLIIALPAVFASFGVEAAGPSLPRLPEPETSIEAVLPSDGRAAYRVDLAENFFLSISAEGAGLDLTLLLRDPSGEVARERDRRPEGGAEHLDFVTDQAGEYRLEIVASWARSDGTEAKTPDEAVDPSYRVELSELRPAHQNDRLRLVAFDAYHDAIDFSRDLDPASQRRAIELWHSTLDAWPVLDQRDVLASTFNNLGRAHRRLGEIDAAIAMYHRSVDAWRQAGNVGEQTRTQHNLASALLQDGQVEAAKQVLEESLVLARSTGDRSGQAAGLLGLASVDRRLGRREAALASLERALDLRQELGQPRAEALILNQIGLLLDEMDRSHRALDRHLDSLRLFRLAEDRHGEAAALNNVGATYSRLGEASRAAYFFRSAGDLSRELGDVGGEAAALNNLGWQAERLDDLDTAEAAYRQAFDLFESLGDGQKALQPLDNLGRISLLSNAPNEAMAYFAETLKRRRRIGDRAGEAVSFNGLGSAALDLEQFESAEESFRNALDAAREGGNRLEEALSLRGLALSEAGRGRAGWALEPSERALDLIEELRAGVADNDLRASYFSTVRRLFEDAISIRLSLAEVAPGAGHAEAAWRLAERATARSLRERLAQTRARLEDPDLADREARFSERLAAAQRRLLSAESPAQRTEYEIQLANIEAELIVSHPSSAPLGAEPGGQFDLPRLPAKSALVSYFLGDEQSFVLTVRDGRVFGLRLPAEEHLRPTVSAMLDGLRSPNRRALGGALRASATLYQQILAPLEPVLGDVEQLIVVPDGVLHYLPFEALLTDRPVVRLSDQPYLLERLTISYAPSAAIFESLRLRQSEAEAARFSLDWLAFGDPIIAAESPEGLSGAEEADSSLLGARRDTPAVIRGGAATSRADLPRLPATRLEIETIASKFPARRVSIHLQDRATETAFRTHSELETARIIHFATHGSLSERFPHLSGLLLSPTADNPEGLLQAHEIEQLDLRAQLVVLSGCETGIGRDIRGEGLLGLTRSFLYAGTPSVVVSLWSVADRSTADLMAELYRRVLDDESVQGDSASIAQALRAAKLQLIESGAYSHPYYWAPFVLTGRP